MKRPFRNDNGKRSYGRATVIAVIMAVALVYTMTRSPLTGDRDLLQLFVTDSDKETNQETASESEVSNAADSAASSRQRSTGASKYPKTQCPNNIDVSNPQRQKIIGTISDPNGGVFHARRTTTKPPFWISLHQQSFDQIRWSIMTSGNYYENKQTESFIDILQKQNPNQPLHFVDVGGNIGWYSLVSVAAAVAVNRSIVVDVFEPNPRNRYRMCESLHLNRWLENDLVDFHLYPLGVSSTSGGVVQMSMADSGLGKLGRVSTTKKWENIDIPLVTLDDMSQDQGWEQKSGPISLLKVDVEGLELEVFQGAKRLLKSGKIENVFFEGNARTADEITKFNDIVTLMVNSGYHAYMHGGWSGADRLVKTTPIPKTAKPDEKPKLLKRYIKSVLAECHSNKMETSHSKNAQCNLWWRKRPATTSSTK